LIEPCISSIYRTASQADPMFIVGGEGLYFLNYASECRQKGDRKCISEDTWIIGIIMDYLVFGCHLYKRRPARRPLHRFPPTSLKCLRRPFTYLQPWRAYWRPCLPQRFGKRRWDFNLPAITPTPTSDADAFQMRYKTGRIEIRLGQSGLSKPKPC